MQDGVSYTVQADKKQQKKTDGQYAKCIWCTLFSFRTTTVLLACIDNDSDSVADRKKAVAESSLKRDCAA